VAYFLKYHSTTAVKAGAAGRLGIFFFESFRLLQVKPEEETL